MAAILVEEVRVLISEKRVSSFKTRVQIKMVKKTLLTLE